MTTAGQALLQQLAEFAVTRHNNDNDDDDVSAPDTWRPMKAAALFQLTSVGPGNSAYLRGCCTILSLSFCKPIQNS